jgi:methionyl-tRNA formyltransferase
VAVGMPARNSEMQLIVSGRCKNANIPFRLFNKKDLGLAIQAWLYEYRPEIVLVKTFPWLIPTEALIIPTHGFINFHYAPLPAWRGTNPLFWMLRNGETTAGVTVHAMNSRYDEGPILMEQSVVIGQNINLGILHTQLAYTGLNLTIQLVSDFNNIIRNHKEQDHSQAKWYGHPIAADLFINWQTMNAAEIVALVRACNPWNRGAGTHWRDWSFGITYASVTNHLTVGVQGGTILSIDANTGFIIASKDRKAVVAEVVYCEEGFYPGYCLGAFGLQKNDVLS